MRVVKLERMQCTAVGICNRALFVRTEKVAMDVTVTYSFSGEFSFS